MGNYVGLMDKPIFKNDESMKFTLEFGRFLLNQNLVVDSRLDKVRIMVAKNPKNSENTQPSSNHAITQNPENSNPSFFSAKKNWSMNSSGSGSPCDIDAKCCRRFSLDYVPIESFFGPAWRNDRTEMSLEFINRGISRFCGVTHWAWMLKSKGLNNDDYFCSIEYGDEGIVIGIYKEWDGIENACNGLMGDSDVVFYKTFQTKRSMGEILSKVDSIKEKWTQNKYNPATHNCRMFADELGVFLTETSVTIIDSWQTQKRKISENYFKKIALDENKIEKMFGSSWKNNLLKVSLKLVESDKASKQLIWILTVDDDFFLSVKYQNDEGIVIDRYDRSHGIDGVCRECIPGSQFIEYTAYSTDKRLKDILQKLDEMKTNWKGMKFFKAINAKQKLNKMNFAIGTKLEKMRDTNSNTVH